MGDGRFYGNPIAGYRISLRPRGVVAEFGPSEKDAYEAEKRRLLDGGWCYDDPFGETYCLGTGVIEARFA